MLCRLRRVVVIGLTGLIGSTGPLVSAAFAAPTLQLRAEQRQKPAQLSLSPLQLYDTEWWLIVEAAPDGAALSRLEYRTRFTDNRPQSKAGGIELSENEALGGRIEIKLPTRDDYDRRMEVRGRVTDAAGNSSDWIIVEFPPEKTIRPRVPGAYAVAAQPDADRKHRVVGTVEYEAADSTSLRVVRDELGRRARAAGGDMAVGVRLVRSDGETFVFAADAIKYLEVAKPTPTAVTLATDRRLGEIVVSYERR